MSADRRTEARREEDSLIEYRVSQLENAHKDMAKSFSAMSATLTEIHHDLKNAKYIGSIVQAVIQGVVIGAVVYVLTHVA